MKKLDFNLKIQLNQWVILKFCVLKVLGQYDCISVILLLAGSHYLTQAAQVLEPEVFIAALRHVVDARCGLAKVADVGNLSKTSLHRA